MKSGWWSGGEEGGKSDFLEEEVGRWQCPTWRWDEEAEGAGPQGKGKDAVSSWHRTELFPEVGWKVKI